MLRVIVRLGYDGYGRRDVYVDGVWEKTVRRGDGRRQPSVQASVLIAQVSPGVYDYYWIAYI